MKNNSKAGTKSVTKSVTIRNEKLLADKSRISLNPRLHEKLTLQEIESLHEIFLNAKDQKFSPGELRNVLLRFNIHFTDDEYTNLFLKINTNRDNESDWDEFVSYLILGFQDDDPHAQKESLLNPIMGPPEVKRSHHKHSIINMSLCPRVGLAKNVDFINDYLYLSTDKEGTINFWDLNMELMRHGKSKNSKIF